MEPTEIKICLTEAAHNIFHQMNIDPFSYGPAYDGESVGLDLYNMGPDAVILGRNKWTAFGEETQVIPTGVRVCLPHGFVGIIKERGSILKTGLMTRAGVIDPGYTGEIFVNLINIGERDTKVTVGAKLPLQLVVIPCHHNFKTVTYQDYLTETESNFRGDGSLGSSDAQ